MQIVTGSIDSLTVLTRAITLANCPGKVLDSICRRLHVLPPGSPYMIDQHGRVHARPWGKKTHRASIVRCQVTIWAAFAGRRPPTSGVHRLLSVTSTKRARTLRGRFGYPGYWWQRVSLDGPANERTIATLDTLVAAAWGLLADPDVRSRVRLCPQCRKWFLRGDGKQTCCSEKCQAKRDRALSAKRVKKWRRKP
jgi:hypothetical protein